MKVSGFGRRLKDTRTKRKLSTVALGELVGVSRTTISNYEREDSYPTIDVGISISEHLNEDPLWMLFGGARLTEIEDGGFETTENIAIIDINSRASDTDVPNARHAYCHLLEGKAPSGGNWITFKMQGDAMSPTASAGDYVLCDVQKHFVDDGLYLIVYTDGAMTFKQLRTIRNRDEKTYEAISHNESYSSMEVLAKDIQRMYRAHKVLNFNNL